MLTFAAVVCSPNKVIPIAFKCAAICAGPVSLATTKELSLIKEDSCDILRALPWSKTQIALICFASVISEESGATTILNLSWNLFLIKSINSL